MVAGILVLSACGDDGDDSAAEDTSNEDQGAEETSAPLPEDTTWIAQANEGVSEIPVYEEPEGTEPIQTLSNPFNVDDDNPERVSPTTFLLVDNDDPGDAEWLHVQLPAPPNGSTGYISTEDVTVYRNNYRITVDRAAFTLTLTYEGEEVHSFPVGLGRDDRATEPGSYFITELIENVNPENAYGPMVYGINGFPDDPDIIAEFGEDATVGVHGTNDPDTIGTAVSSGCIRLNNEDILALVGEEIPLGTPVDVV